MSEHDRFAQNDHEREHGEPPVRVHGRYVTTPGGDVVIEWCECTINYDHDAEGHRIEVIP